MAESKAADTNRTQTAPYPVPTSRPTENSEDGTVPKPDRTWDLSDWFRIF